MLLLVLLPIALLVRACSGGEPTPTPASTSKPKTSTKQTAVPTKTVTATKSAAPTPTPTPTPTITDCVNTDVRVSVTADKQTYAVGEPVTIAMRIANIGTLPCKRDVGALVNEVYVTNVDGLVVWTSDACQKDAKPQVVIMKSKAVFGNTQIWSGLNSGQNCTTAAADAQPGKYLVYARNDVVVSKPFAIELTQ